MLAHDGSGQGWDGKIVDQSGFTRVELLVVLIILGILAVVVIVGVHGLQVERDEDACDAERTSIETAVADFFADTDDFPTSSSELTGGAQPYIRDPAYSWTIDGVTGEVTGVEPLGDGPTPPADTACGI